MEDLCEFRLSEGASFVPYIEDWGKIMLIIKGMFCGMFFVAICVCDTDIFCRFLI